MSLQALFAASTGMEAQQTRIANIANNLANLNTTGYKASRESFEDLMYDQIQSPGTKNSANVVAPVGIEIGHGTKLVGVYKHFSQGEFQQTNREMDVAIEGGGFIQVTLENGTVAYTRDGGLKISAEGNIVNGQGLQIVPSVTVPAEATSLRIGKDGTITVLAADGTTSTLGNIQLALFQNSSGLKSAGHNLYMATDASGQPTLQTPGEAGAGTFAQGFLENSNVNVSEELINMIVAQRSYEANSKVLTTTSEIMKSANNSI